MKRRDFLKAAVAVPVVCAIGQCEGIGEYRERTRPEIVLTPKDQVALSQSELRAFWQEIEREAERAAWFGTVNEKRNDGTLAFRGLSGRYS